MRSITIGAVVAAFAVGGSGFGQQPDPKTPSKPAAAVVPAEIKTLVAQLSAPDFRAREKAGKDLAALGDKSLKALHAALAEVDDPEAARRLEVLIQKIETGRLVNARKVTATFQGTPGKAALEELAKQSGYRLLTNGVGDAGKVTLTLTDVPFWEALDKVCDAAGVTANLQDEDGTIGVYSGESANPFATYSGPFKLVATNINSNKSLQLSGISRHQPLQRQAENLYLNLQVMSEPKAPLIGIGQATIVKATDDLGASLAPPQNPQNGNVDVFYPPQIGYKSFNQNTAINLFRSGRGGTTIKELKVKMPVTILAEVRPDVVFEGIAKAKGKRLAGRSVDVSIKDVSEGNGMVLVSLTATHTNGDPNDYSWTNSLHQRLELYDDKGQKYRSFGLTEQNIGPNVATLTAQFGGDGNMKLGKPAKFAVVEWVPLNRELEFTLKDVPLP